MEKLIELLNEYEKESGLDLSRYSYTNNEYDLERKLDKLSELKPFIKWLVENEKIAYDIPNNSDLYKCFELACIPLDHTDYITMLLSIQDNPIEFLVSILK